MDQLKLYSGAIAAAVSYFILIFTGDIFDINKKQRIIIAIALGILYYFFGEDIVTFIKTIFGKIGL